MYEDKTKVKNTPIPPRGVGLLEAYLENITKSLAVMDKQMEQMIANKNRAIREQMELTKLIRRLEQ